MAWKPGQSGNPGGRPAMPPEVREALTKLTPRAVQVLESLLHSEDERVALDAAKTVLDRNLGKAVQPMEHGGNDGAPLGVSVTFVKPEGGKT